MMADCITLITMFYLYMFTSVICHNPKASTETLKPSTHQGILIEDQDDVINKLNFFRYFLKRGHNYPYPGGNLVNVTTTGKSGHNNIKGNTSIKGNININGNTSIKGNTSIEGNTSIKGNININGNTNNNGNDVLLNSKEFSRYKQNTHGNINTPNQSSKRIKDIFPWKFYEDIHSSKVQDYISLREPDKISDNVIHKNEPGDAYGFLFDTHKTTTESVGKCSDSPSVVLNKTIDCAHPTMSKIDLSDDELVQVLSDKGGTYIKDYMAANHDEARNNFRNLITLTESYDDDNFKRHPRDWQWDYQLTKAKVLEALDISHMQLGAFQPGLMPVDRYVASHWSHWEEKTTDATAPPQIPNFLLTQVTSAKYLHLDDSDTTDTNNTNDDGSTMEYCQNRGAESTDGYLHMCTTCAHTTTLSADKFPRVLNEAVCHSVDSGCLFVGDTPHGSCRQNVFYINMLRKRQGKCVMAIHDGNTVLTDEWELYSQPIRVSCECLINKRSPVAKNVNPN